MNKILIGCLLLCFACTSRQNREVNDQHYVSGPPAIVYKTKKDYHLHVPVLLSDDKSEIISYPHPSDLIIQKGYPYPTILSKGYLLDNRGIGVNVAFLKLTYEEYAKLEKAPPLSELYNMILDKDPLTEMCDCGNKKSYTDLGQEINEIVKKGQLYKKCKKLK